MEQEIVVDDCKMPPYNDALLQLSDMGFGERQAQLAIVHTNGDIERAVEYLLNGGNDDDNDDNNNENNGISQREEIEERKARSHRHHHHRHHSGKGHHHHNHGGASSSEALEDPYIPTFPRYEPSAVRDTFQTCTSHLQSTCFAAFFYKSNLVSVGLFLVLDPTIGSGVTVDRDNSEVDSMVTVASGMMEPQAVEKNSPTETAIPHHHMVNTKDSTMDMDVFGCRGCW
jgi:hypothetical protein